MGLSSRRVILKCSGPGRRRDMRCQTRLGEIDGEVQFAGLVRTWSEREVVEKDGRSAYRCPRCGFWNLFERIAIVQSEVDRRTSVL